MGPLFLSYLPPLSSPQQTPKDAIARAAATHPWRTVVGDANFAYIEVGKCGSKDGAAHIQQRIQQSLLMATSIQQNLVEKNNQYHAQFKEGHLALPPAKKYAVGKDTYLT